MSFRKRLILGSIAAIALVIALVMPFLYVASRNELRAGVDDSLAMRAVAIRSASAQRPPAVTPPSDAQATASRVPPPRIGEAGGSIQFITPAGSVTWPRDGTTVPIDAGDRAVARGTSGARYRDITLDGRHLRVLTSPLGASGAVQITRSLEEVDSVLARFRLIFGVGAGASVLLAALLGATVARSALTPIRKLSDAVAHVSHTTDLTARIDVTGDDELASLGHQFNDMLGAIDQAQASQRAFVSDASHELRTPLAIVKTNLESAVDERMPEADQRAAIADAIEELDEMTNLVEDLLALARGQHTARIEEDVRIDLLVHDIVERYRSRTADVRFQLAATEAHARVDPGAIERAVGNLLENAVKWSPHGGTVDVTVNGAEIAIRDRGPGIEPQDAPHVFDRFYRAEAARNQPGAGLGLSIVKQIADAHDAEVTVEPAPGGGTVARLRLERGLAPRAATPPRRPPTSANQR